MSEQSHFRDENTGIHEVNLINGLKILILEKHTSPIISVAMSYRVGGVDTYEGKTGISHFLEHSLFKGTTKFPKGQIDQIAQRFGGSGNAFTTDDWTSYTFDITSDGLASILEIEADRMRNCEWDEVSFENEKKIILEESSGDVDSPAQYFFQKAEHIFYTSHPYRYPVLGWKHDILYLTLDDLRGFYHRYYVPNNAFLTIVGDVQVNDVIPLVEKYFGNIPSQKLPIRANYQETFDVSSQAVVLEYDIASTLFTLIFPLCASGGKQETTIDLLSSILFDGKSSRFHQRLVASDKCLLQGIGYNKNCRRQTGDFWIHGEILPKVTWQNVESIIWEEISQVQKKIVTPSELQKAKNCLMAEFFFGQATTNNIMETIVEAEALMDYHELGNIPRWIEETQPEEIQEIARQYFRPEVATTMFLVPKISSQSGKYTHTRFAELGKHGRTLPATNPPDIFHVPPKKIEIYRYNMTSGIRDDVTNPQHHRLNNGLQLIMLRSTFLPEVVMSLSFSPICNAYPPEKQGVMGLLHRLLMEGTKNYTLQQLSHIIDSTGGYLSSDRGEILGKFLKSDEELGLSLIAELAQNPLFSESSLEQYKKKMLARIANIAKDNVYQACKKLYEIIYKNHPFSHPIIGTSATVGAIERSDVISTYQKIFTPERGILIIVGDIIYEKTYQLVEKMFGSWDNIPSIVVPYPPVELLQKKREVFIPYDKKQLVILWGHLGIKRNDPDYYKLLLLENIFGSSDGLSDRLNNRIREKLGLCYQIGADFVSSATDQPGIFNITTYTDPKNYDVIQKCILEEIEKVQNDLVTEEELETAKNCFQKRIIFSLETNNGVVAYLIRCLRYQLGFDNITKFLGMISSVSREDIRNVASTHLHPEIATIVSAGPVKEIMSHRKNIEKKNRQKDKNMA